MKWYLKCLREYANFKGRARRLEYWSFTLFNFFFGFFIGLIESGVSLDVGPVSVMYSLAVLIPGLAVSVRRLHDVGKSGWMLLLVFLPIIGGIWLFVLEILDSQPGANKWGPNPKGVGVAVPSPSAPSPSSSGAERIAAPTVSSSSVDAAAEGAQNRYLVFDTETTGLPCSYHASISDLSNWPRVVQLAWQLYDADEILMEERSFIVKPEGYEIPTEASNIHGITTAKAQREGHSLSNILSAFSKAVGQSTHLIGHNLKGYDKPIIQAEYLRVKLSDPIHAGLSEVDTMLATTDYMNLPSDYGPRWPKLKELYEHLFGDPLPQSHDAYEDAKATARCFFELMRRKVIT